MEQLLARLAVLTLRDLVLLRLVLCRMVLLIENRHGAGDRLLAILFIQSEVHSGKLGAERLKSILSILNLGVCQVPVEESPDDQRTSAITILTHIRIPIK